MDGLLSDFRHGLRMLLRTPILSVVAVLTVGLGIGAVTFASSVVYAVIFRGPPVRDLDRLVAIEEHRRDDLEDQIGVPVKDYIDLREGLKSFEVLSGFYEGTVNVAADDGPPERYAGAFVSAHTLGMTGTQPLMGRTFQDGDDVPGAPALIVLGYNPWRTRFGSDPNIVGRTLRVNGEAAQVIGVMPEGFHFPFNQEVWVPYRVDPAPLARRGGQSLEAWGYLRPGVTLEAARAEVEAIGQRIAGENAADYEEITFGLQRFMDISVPSQIKLMMGLLMAMVIGVLLVACANVANVLLARAVVREREVAVRSALGADRWRVIRQLLIEAIVLGLVGGLVGTVLARLSLTLFEASLVGLDKPYWITFNQIDGPVLAFTIVVTLLAAVGAGVWPALRASGGDVGTILRDESRGSSGLRTGRLTHVLVVGELAVSCGLMIAAGLVIHALTRLNQLDLGFDPAPVMTSRIGLFETDYPDPDARSRFYHGLLDRLASEPGVAATALAQGLPGTGAGGRIPFEVDGERYDDPKALPRTGFLSTSNGYFETVGVKLIEGRGFERSESERGGDPVAVVSRSFVERYLGAGAAVGRRIRVGGPDDTDRPWLRVVGVAADAHPGIDPFGGGGTEVQRDAVYVPLAQTDLRFMSILVRSTGAPRAATEAIRHAVTSQDPNLPIYFVRTLQEAVDMGASFHRIFGSLFVIFGTAALFLAAVGLYGVMDFSVSSRTRELGVRTALGASRATVFRLVLGRVASQLALGASLGVGLGLALAIPLASILFGIQVWDPLVYGGIVLVLGLTGLAATIAPAWRAVQVDPVVALRA
ncbi:MAG: ABC transporter permease [Gemmatimonadetes bacterium]|nr:ABC transporter permease [Gemmatimonadota bacterium]